MSEERIAKITNVFLGREDHGIFTCSVVLDYGGSGQVAGNYALDRPLRDEDDNFIGRRGSDFGMEWVIRLMDAAGANEFSDIKGRTVLAVIERGRVMGVKPLPTERGKPFLFADLVDSMGVNS